MLVEMGASVLAQGVERHIPLHYAQINGHEAVVRFLRKNAMNKRRPKSTIVPAVVDPTAQVAAEVAAATHYGRTLDSGGRRS
jgi:ankyrin repeat protein